MTLPPYFSLDRRHSIAREGTGDLSRTWTFRFCGDFISCHSTQHEAINAAVEWEVERVNRMMAA